LFKSTNVGLVFILKLQNNPRCTFPGSF